MSNSKNGGKRKLSFWRSDMPLTSKRVSIILSDPKTSDKLAKAVRLTRQDSHSTKIHPFKAPAVSK